MKSVAQMSCAGLCRFLPLTCAPRTIAGIWSPWGKKDGSLSVQVCGHVAGLHARPSLVKVDVQMMTARKSSATEYCRGTCCFTRKVRML